MNSTSQNKKEGPVVVRVNDVDVNKIVLSPINNKSFNTKGLYYGKIGYGNETTPFNIYIEDLKLLFGMISPYNEEYHKAGKYDPQLYKAVLSLKNRLDIENVITQIDNNFKKQVFTELNQIYTNILNRKKEVSPVYNRILKVPDVDKKREEDKFKDMTDEQIYKEIGANIKIALKPEGKNVGTGKDKKYIVDYNENTLINCILQKIKGVDIPIKKNEKKNLDFYRDTFKRGAVIDIVFQISNWWTKYDSKRNSCEVGIKCVMQVIKIKDLSAINGEIKHFITDDGFDILGDCEYDEDNDENEKSEKNNDDNKNLKDNDDNKSLKDNNKPKIVISDNHIRDVSDNEDDELNNDNFDKENELIEEPDTEKSTDNSEQNEEEEEEVIEQKPVRQISVKKQETKTVSRTTTSRVSRKKL